MSHGLKLGLGLGLSHRPPQSGGGGTPVPLTTIDWENGEYFAGGQSRALEDVVGATPDSSFDSDDVIPGSGLRGANNGGHSAPSLLGAAATDFFGTTGCIVVFDVDVEDAPTSSVCGFEVYQEDTFDPDLSVGIGSDSGRAGLSAILTVGAQSYNYTDPPPDVGPLPAGQRAKVALKITKTEIECCINGGDPFLVSVSEISDWSAFDDVYLVVFTSDYIRSIKIYSPDQNMVTLTAA